METCKTAIRRRALELGFTLCGFTTAAPPEDYPRFREWVAAGLHAGMGYLAADRPLAVRADPTRLLPSARSIIALAAAYPPPPAAENLPLEGAVAAYALGDDYHEVIRARLRTLCEYVSSWTGQHVASRGCVDTAPLLEREIASRAGLGWIGRNSMLIHPRFGSYLFLAEILTELEIPPDPPFTADRCGTCTRCRQACPTGCILPDRTIDSGRCISYLTIEHRGPIPAALRGMMGRAVFGCDLCQTACPWNRNAPPAMDAVFFPRAHFPIRDMVREYLLPEEAWQERFRRSPIRRTGREGYRRNLLIALGNARREEAVPVLEAAARDPDPVLSECAVWALGRIREENA
ncbi:MAG: tRNA epoxyqueuosine(34) reductase QueG [Anaerolineales bacterium]|nr:tRNA epoxyqueuosine(34) reductase QueG [Anaerolineales bacterium]